MSISMTQLLVTTTAEIEQRANLLKNIGVGLGIVAGVFLILSIFIFVKMDISTVIGEKTGSIAKKTIEELEKESARSGKLQGSGGVKKKEKNDMQKMNVQALFNRANQETGPITEKLNDGNNQTTVLEQTAQVKEQMQSNGMTEILTENRNVLIGKFIIIRNIILIHTDETITNL